MMMVEIQERLKNPIEDNNPLPPLLEARNLWKIYDTPAGGVEALRGVSFTLYPGEFIALIGKSGAGKSTLVNVLTCIDSLTEGEIYFNGQAIHTMTDEQKTRWRGKNLGVVFQFFQLLPTLNLAENIKIAMDLLNAYPVAERHQRALALLKMVGIEEHAYKIPAKISGGQQQRVAIARALANDPPLIIADEPTGNLDSRTAGEIYDLFANLLEKGKTVFLVSHDRAVKRWATRVIEIADGELVE